MIEIKVPARICFYGDHQDYLGLPVIAGTIDRFINLKANPNSDRKYLLKLLDLKDELSISLDDGLKQVQADDYFRSVMVVLKEQGFQLDQGYDIEISGNIPVNAGLSSSSALVVAWIRFLVATQGKSEDISDYQIGRWAYEAEVLFFDQPGGLMDQYTIAQKGLIYIDTQSGESTRLNADLGKLLVAESGVPKKTLEVLKNARVYAQEAVDAVKKVHPEFVLEESCLSDYEKYIDLVPEEFQGYWYATIYNYHITLEAKKELLKPNPNISALGDLMNQHQIILQNQIKNTPSEMVEMMDVAREMGALGTKIIGSGGGGCMVAMVTDAVEEQVKQAFLDKGAKAVYAVELTS
ncbi:Galactokinase [Allomuricauda ruestringensis DSM 13258]|uniref:Galactokinase n=1 Tax=Allomuricauda ruestringensis (strain DSM 13258 / CIP 107369 / LMG 19739 / B1) TaxID=886377 RepID=G2PLR0_ALLRU|nr:GHMP kinase [Allomuricauda ruestringensis]AEM71147.1 Galactokinase [Allomuricauda ruestringensis DSM 13258]